MKPVTLVRRLVSSAALALLVFGGSRPLFAAPKEKDKPADVPTLTPVPPPPKAPHVPASNLPPFFGLFGSADLIAKVGFRGNVGTWIEFRLQPKGGTGQTQTMRYAQVGPEVADGRWIEMSSGTSGDGSGLRLLVHGLEKGNVERIVGRKPGATGSEELPLDAMRADMPIAAAGDSAGATLLSDAKHLGQEEVEVPLGKFKTEHWLVASRPKRMEIWTTRDKKVPFTGMVKMLTDDGLAVATRTGTDAEAIVPLPDGG